MHAIIVFMDSTSSMQSKYNVDGLPGMVADGEMLVGLTKHKRETSFHNNTYTT